MRTSELAKRYAKAIFEISIDTRAQEKTFNDLRELDRIFHEDPRVREFLESPIISSVDRKAVVTKAIADKGLSKEVMDLVLLIADNGRFGVFHELVGAFQAEADAANNVCRGTVRSATVLGQGERQRVEETVEKVLKKKVIMTYKVDPSVIGGLVAQVGSYTFDDSISAHLQRMNEELKRRTV